MSYKSNLGCQDVGQTGSHAARQSRPDVCTTAGAGCIGQAEASVQDAGTNILPGTTFDCTLCATLCALPIVDVTIEPLPPPPVGVTTRGRTSQHAQEEHADTSLSVQQSTTMKLNHYKIDMKPKTATHELHGYYGTRGRKCFPGSASSFKLD